MDDQQTTMNGQTDDDTLREDPRALAYAVVRQTADLSEQVGDFVNSIDLDGQVTEFRFTCLIAGYEGWQWSVTLFHDEELGRWTVDETSLVPTDSALQPRAWIPWKDRLRPTDLSVTDSIGTSSDDPRLQKGIEEADSKDEAKDTGILPGQNGQIAENPIQGTDDSPSEQNVGEEDRGGQGSAEDLASVIEEFQLSRRHVLSPLGRAQTAKRWNEGQHGPKSLSTKTADGNVCETCGFMIPIVGELGNMFAVCANKWSPDDGRVVSLDHGCGEHSEIEPAEASHLWVQSEPVYDNLHIDVLARVPREERSGVELIEQLEDGDPSDIELLTDSQGIISDELEEPDPGPVANGNPIARTDKGKTPHLAR